MNAKYYNVLLLVESARESGRQFISGIADYANHYGPWQFHWMPHGIRDCAEILSGVHYDGIITRDLSLSCSNLPPNTPMVELRHSKSERSGSVFVQSDDRSVSRIAVDHFLKRGFSNFAFCGDIKWAWSQNRGKCFANILKEQGFQADMLWIDSESFEADATRQKVEKWLLSLPKPVAIMAANDDIGQAVVQICRRVELRVPQDCAFVGVDNDPIVCGLSNPPLSSIGLCLHQAGYRAAAVLADMMKGGSQQMRTIKILADNLVVRKSSDIFAVQDESVAKALRLMHENADTPLPVDAIAHASGVSRRVLEKRFRDELATSVHQYCRELRADRLARVLRDTDLSIEEIGEQAGFSKTSHFSRFFKSIKGASPSQWRKLQNPSTRSNPDT